MKYRDYKKHLNEIEMQILNYEIKHDIDRQIMLKILIQLSSGRVIRYDLNESDEPIWHEEEVSE